MGAGNNLQEEGRGLLADPASPAALLLDLPGGG
jgi:hypothetical protein